MHSGSTGSNQESTTDIKVPLTTRDNSAGIILGVVMAALVIVGIGYFWYREHKKRQSATRFTALSGTSVN